MPLLSAYVFADVDETPVIVQAPKNLQWPEGSDAFYKCVCENDPGHMRFEYEWHIVYEGKDYAFNGNMNDPWCDYIDKTKSGTVENAIYFYSINHGLNGAEIYCVVKNHNVSVFTPSAVILIIDEDKFTPPEITAPVYVRCMQGDVLDLQVKGTTTAGNVDLYRDYISYHWYSTESGSITDIEPIETGKDIYENNVYRVDTGTPGTYYFICGVFDGVDNINMCNRSYTNVIMVEVEEKIENVGIELVSAPDKTEYTAGDTLDLKGLKVKILLSKGSIVLEDGAGVSVSAAKLDKEGEQTVTVTYEGLSTEFKVNVKPAATETETETKTDTETNVTAEATETETAPDTDTAEVTTDAADTSGADTANVPADTEAEKTSENANVAVIVLAVVAGVLFIALIAVVVLIIVMTKKKNSAAK